MRQSALTRELALRIGLASRALPDTAPKLFMSILHACVGPVLDGNTLAELGEDRFRQALSNFGISADPQTVRLTLGILQSIAFPDPPKPQTLPADAAGSILVAVVSDDPTRIAGHFGSCRQFLIYQVSADEARLIDIRSVDMDAQRRHADKNTYRAELIADCRVLYTASIGGPAAAKVVKFGIHPIKTELGAVVSELLNQLQTVLADAPPPWLAKSMGIRAGRRISLEQESIS
ncbi:NifB/NifX family molybdenum-iron cluster-binding protein [Methylomonas sp. UP202]|uniref:NifB/NifX family molybdenum-iron cluster-binding protein n=1 Tax=Methylomonas sp. UP202 TaxID=3040943 RepID=UPI00247A6C17|nr:NifB/NifX family molybdenum-iron cluster-binding protein [Methylomonas sp. UP202]WGS86988.1 NifB/NifX family molybdenum-iron cluster-binding protein [Methylomonas sp. UP202]